MAYRLIEKSRVPVSLIFKDFEAKFLKRAEGDVEFSCEQGTEIAEFVKRVIGSTERQEMKVIIEARVPEPQKKPRPWLARAGEGASHDPREVIARFELTLSLKRRGPVST